MTAEEHNKYLGIAHVVYGVLHILLMVVTAAIIMGMMGFATLNAGRSNGPPMSFMVVIMAFVVIINMLLAIPSFVAGYAFLTRKPWAKIAGIVAAVLSALRVPFGTAVSIYTFWFLFSAPGKTLYDNLPQALPPALPADWSAVERTQGSKSYAPPTSPPDLR
jgi:heme/copper-type cytochrome/quinol oxidase subunit 2